MVPVVRVAQFKLLAAMLTNLQRSRGHPPQHLKQAQVRLVRVESDLAPLRLVTHVFELSAHFRLRDFMLLVVQACVTIIVINSRLVVLDCCRCCATCRLRKSEKLKYEALPLDHLTVQQKRLHYLILKVVKCCIVYIDTGSFLRVHGGGVEANLDGLALAFFIELEITGRLYSGLDEL